MAKKPKGDGGKKERKGEEKLQLTREELGVCELEKGKN